MKSIFSIVCIMLVCRSVYATRPTTHASNLTANNLQCNSVRLNWSNGDGAARLILAKEGGNTTYVPSDGDMFNADPSFGFSQNLATDNFIVYNANGTNYVTILNLQPGKTYCFTIFEHDNNNNSTEYLTTGGYAQICITTYTINMNFTTRVIDSCQMSNSFEFTNTSTSTIPSNLISYRFDFGNGTSTNSPVTHHFLGGGYKNVTVTPLTSITGCQSLYVRNVKIFPKKIGYIDPATFEDTQCLEGNYFEVISTSPVQPFPMGVTYRWWYGDNDSSNFPKMKKTYKIAGNFIVRLELTATSYSKPTNCKDTLEFPVWVLPSPVGNVLINDTFQCLKHNNYTFENPDNSLAYFRWYFGDDDSSDLKLTSHRYGDTGHYKVMHVAYANTGCKGRDTLDIFVLPDLDSRFNGLDTFYCQSEIADILYPLTKGGIYQGFPVSGDSLIPDQVGNYTLSYIIKDKYCSDTTNYDFRVFPTPVPEVGNDTAICNAINYMLDAQDAGQNYVYQWNTGHTSKTINVTSTGKYKVTVSNGRCQASDSAFVTFSTPPIVNIGNDTVLCRGGGIWLKVSYPKSSYLWNTGSTDSQIFVFAPGKYSVTVTNPCGVTTDSVFVYFQGDYCDLFMANAFTPGNDFINNVFIPRGRNISVQLFQIFNRWGEMVFQTDQDGVGWDGTYKGELVQEGLYIWKLFYTTPNGPFIKKSNAFGQVILIR